MHNDYRQIEPQTEEWMNRVLVLAICFFMIACSSAPVEVTLKLVQPVGQKSVYSMKNQLRVEAGPISSPQPQSVQLMTMDASFETEATSNEPNGNWTLVNKYNSVNLQINGIPEQSVAETMVGKTFTVTLGKDGKVLDVKGTEALGPGMDPRQMMTQMNPTMMLPGKPVRTGDTWPFELSLPMDMQGTTINQTIKGTGTLKQIEDGGAMMDFEYSIQMSSNDSGPSQMKLTGNGKGKVSAVYDIEKARFIANKNEMTLQAFGDVNMGERVEKHKSTIMSTVQIELINK
jgi:hypothetical protein